MTPAGADLAALEARARALVAGPGVSAPTRRVLQARLDQAFDDGPRVLTAAQMRTLQAVCLRLIPQPELVARVQLAAALDARLAGGRPRGWRYAEAPDDLALVAGGLDELAGAAEQGFASLPATAQDARLRAAQAKEGGFDGPLARWFEELLSAVVELYYAHPLVQAAIGYDGMVDVGARAVGLAAAAAEGDRLAV